MLDNSQFFCSMPCRADGTITYNKLKGHFCFHTYSNGIWYNAKNAATVSWWITRLRPSLVGFSCTGNGNIIIVSHSRIIHTVSINSYIEITVITLLTLPLYYSNGPIDLIFQHLSSFSRSALVATILLCLSPRWAYAHAAPSPFCTSATGWTEMA